MEILRARVPQVRTVRRDDVVRIAHGWIGTPYHHQASCRGVGADCLGVVRGIYRSLYGSDATAVPAYSADLGEAAGEETLLDAARRNLRERMLSNPQPGDVLVFRMVRGAIAKHTGVLTSPTTLLHGMERVGVVEVRFAGWWRRRLVGVFSFPGIED